MASCSVSSFTGLRTACAVAQGLAFDHHTIAAGTAFDTVWRQLKTGQLHAAKHRTVTGDLSHLESRRQRRKIPLRISVQVLCP